MSINTQLLLDNLNRALELSDCDQVKSILDKCILDIQKSINADPKLKILGIMTDTTPDSPMSTVDIAKASGLGSTRKAVNKYLYDMQREGTIRKISEADGTKPRWYIV